MIVTVTFNPSLDYNIEICNLDLNLVNRFETYNYMPGGKGINISTLLNNVGIKTITTGFVAGFTGDELVAKISDFKKIQQKFIYVDGETRLNVKLHTDGGSTEVNGKGPNISVNDLNSLSNAINEVKDISYLIIAGTPPANHVDAYKLIISKLVESDVKLAIDATGNSLSDTFEYKPFIVKPNHHELGEIFGVEINTKADAVKYAKKLLEKGVQNVIVSLGKDGAVFVNNDVVFDGISPKGDVLSTVGAGDSMLAGFIAKYSETECYRESFKFALASGSATAFSSQIAKHDLIKKVYDKVQVNNYENN